MRSLFVCVPDDFPLLSCWQVLWEGYSECSEISTEERDYRRLLINVPME